jgi:hypothetical protein
MWGTTALLVEADEGMQAKDRGMMDLPRLASKIAGTAPQTTMSLV